jgi:hypothetical protein
MGDFVCYYVNIPEKKPYSTDFLTPCMAEKILIYVYM